jgi:hypothetical protein
VSKPFAVTVLTGLFCSALALAVAPALLPADYSWIANTTSESAAQGISGAWLARLGFLLFGLSVIPLACRAAGLWGHVGAVLHFAFGALLAMVAAFSSRPWTTAPYDGTEDFLHSLAATAMGFAFAGGVVAAVVYRRKADILDISAVAASVLIPLAMVAFPDADGLFQRVMFAIAYVWYAAVPLAAARQSRRRDDQPRAAS